MKSKWFLLLPIFMSLFSCSTALRVTSKECNGKLYLAKLKNSKLANLNRVSRIEEKNLTSFSFIGNAETVYLNDFLRKERVDCDKSQALTLTLKNTWSDVLLSLIPFMTRTTVKVSVAPVRTLKKKIKGKVRTN